MQQPLPSGFTAAHTADDVLAGIDLTGKNAVVTGGYAGLGLETVHALRRAGAHVIVPARDMDKARAALANLDGVEVLPMDLVDPASIDAFANTVVERGQPLHILINNAGVLACPLERDARGYERQFTTNHLGHFQLAVRLWPALKRAHGARIVSLSSRGHHYAPVDFQDPHFQHHEYNRWTAYGQSKTANVLFALGADARGKADGIRAFAVHPGAVTTGLGKYMTHEELLNRGAVDEQGNPVVDLDKGMKNAQQGASTSVWAAASPQLDGLGGLYLEDNDVAIVFDSNYQPGDTNPPKGVNPHAIDPDAADALWELSEHETGAKLPA